MLVKYNVTEMKHTFNRSFPCISYLFNIVAVFGKRRVFLRKQTIGQHLISNAMQSPTPSWQRLLLTMLSCHLLNCYGNFHSPVCHSNNKKKCYKKLYGNAIM